MRSRQMPRGAALAVAALLAACAAGNPVRIREVPLQQVFSRAEADAYATDTPSDRTLALVDRLGCAQRDLAVAVARLEQPQADLAEAERLLALAELLYHQGERAASVARARLFLRSTLAARAAVAADHAVAPGSLSPRRHTALRRYSLGLTRFLDALGELRTDALVAGLARDFGVRVVWQADPDREPAWTLADFDELIVADRLAFEGLRHRYRIDGAGVPLVAHRDGSRGVPAYLTPEAINRPVTAVLVAAENGEELRIVCPRSIPEIELAPGLVTPVAADFTAPFGHLLATAALHAIEDGSFFDADADGHEGLFLLEDYDPDRVPVVMIHGLWSSPLTWRDLTNDIFGDATLHGHYQVWHLMYPTGAPLLENARLLRETLRKARADLDPELDDRASRGIVVIGHSMGGLLTRIGLTNSGDAIWNTLYDAEWDAVAAELDGEERALAEALYFWQPVEHIERAIFVAAPHHGSEMADSWIGRLGSSMMRIPRRLLDLVNRIRSRGSVRVEVPTSVDELSMAHPVMLALGRLTVREGVPYHSLMGDVSGSDDPEQRTDGVVPYVSSHLRGAASELVIPGADHNAHHTAEASAEIRRILREAIAAPRDP